MNNLFAYSVLFLLFLSVVVPAADITVFSMPDNSYATLASFLGSAENNVAIAAYTLSSIDIAGVLSSIMKREVGLEVLVEKSPVGGMSIEEKQILCVLQQQGAEVFVYDGPLHYHHAKYIIRDNKDVLISTDNFGYSSFPLKTEHGIEYNRGWGIIVYDDLSEDFLEIYKQDLADSVPYTCSMNISTTSTTTTTIGRLETQEVSVSAMFAPDNAEQRIMDIINQTTGFLYIEQLYIYRTWDTGINPFLETAIEKARQGVDVRILLDGRFFNEEQNNETIQYLQSLNISNMQALIHPRMPLHVKGIVSDNTAVISSVNWNENSVRNNREAGVIITGEAVKYYENMFLNDWQEATAANMLTGQAIDIEAYSLEIIFIAAALLVIIVFLLKNNAFR